MGCGCSGKSENIIHPKMQTSNKEEQMKNIETRHYSLYDQPLSLIEFNIKTLSWKVFPIKYVVTQFECLVELTEIDRGGIGIDPTIVHSTDSVYICGGKLSQMSSLKSNKCFEYTPIPSHEDHSHLPLQDSRVQQSSASIVNSPEKKGLQEEEKQIEQIQEFEKSESEGELVLNGADFCSIFEKANMSEFKQAMGMASLFISSPLGKSKELSNNRQSREKFTNATASNSRDGPRPNRYSPSNNATPMKQEVIISIGGIGENDEILNSCEIYIPESNKWISSGRMNENKYGSAIINLTHSTIYVIGGCTNIDDIQKSMYSVKTIEKGTVSYNFSNSFKQLATNTNESHQDSHHDPFNFLEIEFVIVSLQNNEMKPLHFAGVLSISKEEILIFGGVSMTNLNTNEILTEGYLFNTQLKTISTDKSLPSSELFQNPSWKMSNQKMGVIFGSSHDLFLYNLQTQHWTVFDRQSWIHRKQ